MSGRHPLLTRTHAVIEQGVLRYMVYRESSAILVHSGKLRPDDALITETARSPCSSFATLARKVVVPVTLLKKTLVDVWLSMKFLLRMQ